MARIDEARSATSSLHRYSDVVSEACFDHRGSIPETPEKQTAIDSLLKYRLAYRIEDELSVQLSSVVIRFMNHATKSYRLRQSSGAVADLLDSLRFAAENYRSAQKAGDFEEQQGYEAEIQELVYETIDLLNTLTQQFAYQVHNEFSTISVLEIRIRENERCLGDINRLNVLFASLTVNELYEMAGHDTLLERLLLKVLKRTIDICHQDLVSTAHRLRETLAKLYKDKKGQHLNQLIDLFHKHYYQNPGFVPSIDAFTHIPEPFQQITPLKLDAYADLENPLQTDKLGVLAQQVATKRHLTEQQTDTLIDVRPVSDCRDAAIEEVDDPLSEKIDFFFEAILTLKKGQQLSAIETYQQLDVEDAPDVWLLALAEHYRTRRQEFSNSIQLQFNESSVGYYSGNHIVFDLTFKCVADG